MFYFDTIKSGSKDKKILKSTVMDEFQADFKHLFTTKESFIKTGDENLKNLVIISDMTHLDINLTREISHI